MKLDDFNLITTCFVAAVVMSLTAPSKSHENMPGNETETASSRDDSGEFPALVRVYTLLFSLYFVLVYMMIPLISPLDNTVYHLVQFSAFFFSFTWKSSMVTWVFLSYQESTDQDFVVKFKGEIFESAQLEKPFSVAPSAQHQCATRRENSWRSALPEELFRPVVSRQMFLGRKNRYLVLWYDLFLWQGL